jgi:signal transduction histidine kinase
LIAEKTELALKRYQETVHDIKTPVTILRFISRDLETSPDLPEDARKIAARISDYCHRIGEMLSDITETDKLLCGRLSPLLLPHDIVAAAEWCVQSVVPIAARKNIEIVFDTNVEEFTALTDKNMLERMMLNLLSNAIKFTPGGGLVQVNLFIDGADAVIDVIDNGVGFTDAETNAPFVFRAPGRPEINAEGSGIGLAITAEMAEALGGRIEAAKSERGGARLVVTIPLNDGQITLFNKQP